MAEKNNVKTKLILQVPEGDFDLEKVADMAVKDCKKNNKGAIKDINVYVKPEDKKAYYTANKDSITGSVDL